MWRLDFISVSIYAVIGIAILYMAAAVGTSLDLSVDENDKNDFNVFSQQLNDTVSDYALVLKHLQIKGSNANFTEKVRNMARRDGQMRKRKNLCLISLQNKKSLSERTKILF